MTVAKLSAHLLARKGHAGPVVSVKERGRGQKRSAEFLQEVFAEYAGGTTSMFPRTNSEKRVQKKLRLGSDANHQLRLLSARMGVPQQQLMESAVIALLKQVQAEETCICKIL